MKMLSNSEPGFLAACLLCVSAGASSSILVIAADDPAATGANQVADAKLPATITQLVDDWFWPDPYSHLGHIRSNGSGWEFVRLAGDAQAGRDAGLTAEVISAINAIYKKTTSAPKDGDDDRVQRWAAAEREARKLVDEEQAERIEQFVIQRRGFDAFRDATLAKSIRLTDVQRSQIENAWKQHLQKVVQAAKTLKTEADRLHAKSSPLSERDKILLAQLKREKMQRGWLSHRNAWNATREILSDDQQIAFRKRRGSQTGRWAPKRPVNSVDQTVASKGTSRDDDAPEQKMIKPKTPGPEDVRSEAGQAKFLEIKEMLRDHLRADLELQINSNPNAILMTSYGNADVSEGSPLHLFYRMIPPAYRHSVRSHPKLHRLEFSSAGHPLVSQETLAFVDFQKTDAIDSAIELMLQSELKLSRLAAEVISLRRKSLSPQQWLKIVKSFQFVPSLRNEYPLGVEVNLWGLGAIPFGWLLFDDPKIAGITSETHSMLDGKQVATQSDGGWRVNLPGVFLGTQLLGSHSIEFVQHYKLTLGDQVVEGRLNSTQYDFQVVPTQPDGLAATMTDSLREQVTSSIIALPITDGRERTYSQATGDGTYGPIAKLRIPYLELTERLPVALVMQVEVHFGASEEPHKRPDLVFPAGTTGKYEVEGMTGDGRLVNTLAARADQKGIVDARIVMTPSCSAMLAHSHLDSYYPEPIELEAQFQLLWTERGKTSE